MNFRHWSIGRRLGAGFGIILCVLVVVAALGIGKLREVSQLQRHIAQRYDTVQLAQQWAGQTGINLTRTMAIANAGGLPELSAYAQPLMKETSALISSLQAKLEAGSSDAASRTLMATVGENRKVYLATRDRAFALFKAGDAPAGRALATGPLQAAAEQYLAAIAAYVDHQKRLNVLAAEAARDTVENAVLWSVVLAVGALLLGALFAWTITRSVTLPLHAAVRAAEAVAQGDLTGAMASDRGDELGRLLQALDSMQTQLRHIAHRIQVSAGSIRTATVEIASGNQDLSDRTERSAASIQQTASAVEELSGAVKLSADAAEQANQLAANASIVARKGGELVSNVVSTMSEINRSSKQIADITGVIDGIAFQTNILALNAAVEAARAGEQGRGFAVVASEVRTLAQRSAQAAKEIKHLISSSVQKVENGSELVNDTGVTMQEIVASVQRVADIIGEIGHATAEQSTGLSEINIAIAQLDQSTQQNAALVEEAAAAAISLQGNALQLTDMAQVFRLPPMQDGAFTQAA